MRRKNLKIAQKGFSILLLVAAMAGASLFYILNVQNNVSFLSTFISKEQKIVSTKAFLKGTLYYTIFAIQERWLMNDAWSRMTPNNSDPTIFSDMKTFVNYPLNLERFLWSEATINDMAKRYEDYYGTPVSRPENFLLTALSHNLLFSTLKEQSINHPLNVIFDPSLERCFSGVKISITKDTTVIPQGDETYLIVQISLKKKDEKDPFCANQLTTVRSQVAFFPRTLNQFTMIKAGDLNLNNFTGSVSDSGIKFHSPVYIEDNLVINKKSPFSPVTFYESVVLGSGRLQDTSDNGIAPTSYGGDDSMFSDQYPSFRGLLGGIRMEGEFDEGISKLFDKNYTFDAGLSMMSCQERFDLRFNPSETARARLWAKRAGTDQYILALSAKDEFRETGKFGVDPNTGQYVKYTPLTPATFWTENISVSATPYTNEKVTFAITPYVMGSYRIGHRIHTFYESLGMLYLSRNSSAEIIFGDKDKIEAIKDRLNNTEDQLNDIDVLLTKISSTTHNKEILDSSDKLKERFIDLYSKCSDLKNKDWKLEECKIIDQSFNSITTDCDDICDEATDSDCEDTKDECRDLQDSTRDKYRRYSNQSSELADEFSHSIPKVTISISDNGANQVKLKVTRDNFPQFSTNLFKEIEEIKFDFYVYDFGNVDGGGRIYDTQKIGPNDDNYHNNLSIRTQDHPDRLYYSNYSDLHRWSDDTYADENWDIIKLGDDQENLDGSWSIDEDEGDIEFPAHEDIDVRLTTEQAKNLDINCGDGTGVVTMPSWDISFLDNTRFSWLYNITAPGISLSDSNAIAPLDEYTFNAIDQNPANYKGIPTRSIVEHCIVPAGMDFVFGFYVCELLEIQTRSKPLTMIGTFVVENLKIASSAIASGIDFYSIWHPDAIKILQDKKHLVTVTDGSCNTFTPSRAFWRTDLPPEDISNLIKCSPMKFVYEGANNFNWTTIDPELGIVNPTDTTTQSKVHNRYRRYKSQIFMIKEIR